MKRTYGLVHAEARRRAAADCMNAPDGWVVTVSEPTRTLEQNAAQWPILQAFANQKQMVINGKLEWVTPEDWKDVLTAVHKAEMRVAVFQGRMILLGQRTKRFLKSEFSEWLDFLHATAAEMDVDLDYQEAA